MLISKTMTEHAVSVGEKTRKRQLDFSTFPLDVGISFLLFPLAVVAFYATLLSLTQSEPFPGFYLAAPLVFSLAVLFFFFARIAGEARAALTLGALAVAVIVSVVLANIYFDVSFDGTTYHQEGILAMRDGFHFVQQPLGSEESLGRNPLYITTYTKFSWLYGAWLLEFASSVHWSKSLNFLFLFAIPLVAWVVLPVSRVWAKVLGALVLTANPVAIAQMFTNYVDGALSSALTVGVLALWGISQKKNVGRMVVLAMSAAAIVASLKTAGSAFGGILFVGVVVALFAQRRQIAAMARANAAVGAGLLVIMFAAVFNPYLSNVVQDRHILHPAFGEERFDWLMGHQSSEAFLAEPRTTRLLLSVFAETQNRTRPTSPDLPTVKVPFTVFREEIQVIEAPDTRWGGWGPLFSGAFVLAVVLAVAGPRTLRKHIVVVGVLAVLSVVHPESWWARYSPQLYTLVTVVAIVYLAESRRLRATAVATLLTLLVNSLIVYSSVFSYTEKMNERFENRLNAVSSEGTVTVCWVPNRHDIGPVMDRLGISYTRQSDCDDYLEDECKKVYFNNEIVCGRHQGAQ